MKKGFTLIELLAVIVILAIIALIATPIVLSIINDSKKSAIIRSGEFYINAVENAIMQHNMKTFNTLTPKECVIQSDGNAICDGVELEVEVDGEKPTSGVITFDKGNLEYAEGITFDGGSISSGANGELVQSTYRKKCVAVTENTKTTGNVPKGNFEPGDEYICEVKQGTKYHFFVVDTPNDKVALILDRNVYYDSVNDVGGLVSTQNKGIVPWTNYGTEVFGPDTSMLYLYEATKTWTNLDNIVINYTNDTIGYNISFNQETNITKLTPCYEGNCRFQVENLKARMPYYNELTASGCLSGDNNGSCALYMSNYLNSHSAVTGTGLQNISGINGYWSFASNNSSSIAIITHQGKIGYNSYTSTIYGVRPVIEVYKDNLEH